MATETSSIDREALRVAIEGLALYVVVGESDDARDVKNRNRMDKPRLWDAVLLDDLWDLLDEMAVRDGD